MAYIQISNKLIRTPIQEILEKIRADTGYRYLHDIKVSNKDLRITCPFHNGGQEKNPDCFICTDSSSEMYGVYHCFACGKRGYITDIVNQCFGQSGNFGSQWLVDNFADTLIEQVDLLPEIELNKEREQYLDESILDKYRYFHPYMFKRHLTENVIKAFSVGYDPEDDCITFPVWDVQGHLVFITKRSVKSKYFYIPTGVSKPVYLLNYIIKNNITKVLVCESQINCLTAWGWGYPAVALFGTGSKDQYNILKRSGIRTYILCFDGDAAGDSGIKRFKENISNDVFVSVKQIPRGKDLNDLTKDEFDSLKTVDL